MIEHLRKHAGMNFNPDHPPLARHRIARARERRIELVKVRKIATDQDVATPNRLGHQPCAVGIGEQIDRQLVEHRAILGGRYAKADRAEVVPKARIGIGALLGGQRHRQHRRQICILVRPPPRDCIGIGFKQNAHRADRRRAHRVDIFLEILLLLECDRVGVGLVVGVSEEHRGLHCLQRRLQQYIFRLRRIEQDIDAHALGPKLVDLCERMGQDRAIDW